MLLFLPATVMLLATFAGAAYEQRGKEEAILLYTLIAAFLAAPLCIVMGFVFTKPDPRWQMRAGWILLAALLIAFLNYSIALGGCVLVIR